MATISENLQIIKNSTDAIKQAIIDKGGEISGDITTWADAILNIPTGPTQINNQIKYTSSGCTAQYPVTSDLTINVTGRKTSDAASAMPYSFDIYIPKGKTVSTSTRSIFSINSITPSSDESYYYVF